MTTERSTRSAAKDESGSRDDVFALIERLPFIGSVAKEVTHLRALLVDRRPPRILALGAKGSGKSGLANALLGAEVLNALPAPAAEVVKTDAAKVEAPVAESTSEAPPQAAPEGPQVDAGFPVVHGAWMRVTAVGRQLAWLELNAGEAERESMRLLQNALEEHVPDVLLVLVRAEDVEGDLALVIESLKGLHALIESKVGAASMPRLVPVVSCADLLVKPAEFALPPYPADVLAQLERATLRVRLALSQAGLPFGSIERAIPCTATHDLARRWNIEEVADAIFAKLPASTHVEGVRALPVSLKHVRNTAMSIVSHCSAIAVTIGLAPIPFSDSFILLPLQGLMVTAVAYSAGQPWDKRAGLEWLGSVGIMGGAAFGMRWGAQQLVKLVPGAGTLVSASVAGAGTLALGKSAVSYFVEGAGRRTRVA
jgi:uncharacterized protein (DUF697 family)